MKTSDPILFTIFGNERCVASLDDLEAVAHAIHSKAVRERVARKRISTGRGADSAQPPERQSETSAHPSTFGTEIEGQIRPINAESSPSKTESKRNPAPALGEMLVWLDALRERSERLDDSTPVRAWDFMLRAFALQTALRSDDAHPDFRATAMVNLHRLVHELKGMGL